MNLFTLKKLFFAALLITLLSLAVFTGGCDVITGAQVSYDQAVATARTEMWKGINQGTASSGAAAIMDNGKTVYVEGFGMADRAGSVPADNNTLFNIGSISKVYVAAAIMVLVDEGTVALDAPVTSYLPDFTMADERYQSITVRMLLNHSSGLPGGTYVNNFAFEPNPDLYQDTLDNLARSYLKHDPGAMAPYCNEGFNLAEMVVARVSGQSYISFLQENIFQPLGLKNTGLSVGEQAGTVARFYRTDTGKAEPAEVISLLGAGGLSATVEDLCRFMDSFSGKGKQVLSDASLAEMLKPQPSAFSAKLESGDLSYGLGWDITSHSDYSIHGYQMLGKSGGTGNYTSMVYTIPEIRLTVAVIGTSGGSDSVEIAFNLLRDIMAAKGLVPADEAVVSSPPEAESLPAWAADYEGYYTNGGGLFSISANRDDNIMVLSLVEAGTETPILGLYYRDGGFYDDAGDRHYFTTIDGTSYLVQHARQFGADAVALEKISAPEKPLSLGIDINGKQWLRRNMAAYEGFLLDEENIVTSSTIEEFPGYIMFSGLKKVESADFAGMAVASRRDQTELTLWNNNGETWAWVSDRLYSPAEAAGIIMEGETSVTIVSEGCNEWLKTETGLILSFNMPAGTRVFVTSADSVKIYDSAMDDGDVWVPEGHYVQFAGKQGDTLTIIAKERSDKEKQELVERTIRYQTEGDVYHADSYEVVKLTQGDIIYGMLPGQSVFYMDEATMQAGDGSYTALYELTQIRPHPVYGYRTNIGKYEVQEDIYVAAGVCLANREITIDGNTEYLGEGGGYQYVIFDFSAKLKLVEETELHE